MVRLFCSTVYVFNRSGNKCLFLNHRKLQKWLPPGGKIDPNELPDDAAVRECLEETGMAVTLVGERAQVPGGLIRPFGMQLNTVIPGEREHIDFVYLGLAEDMDPVLNIQEASEILWIPIEKIMDPHFNTFDSVKMWVKQFSDFMASEQNIKN